MSRCAARGCDKATMSNGFMCLPHWAMVDRATRRRWWASKEFAPNESTHFRNCAKAVEEVHAKEVEQAIRL